MSDNAVFARMMAGLAAEHGEKKTVMIEVSRRTPCVRVSLRKDLRAHRTATSMGVSSVDQEKEIWAKVGDA